MLAEQGARLTVCDVARARVDEVVRALGASAVAPESIFDVEADVFSPNAAGGILSRATIPRLRCRAVVGGANDQLADDDAGPALHARGILYGPDYVVNAGGLISVLLETGALDEAAVLARVRAIGDTVAEIWAGSRREDAPPARVADAIVEQRLAAARAAREET